MVRDCDAISPISELAENTYLIVWFWSVPLENPVTTSTGVVALVRSTSPALFAFELSRLINSFVPSGILLSIDATIFMFSKFVVTLYLEF